MTSRRRTLLMKLPHFALYAHLLCRFFALRRCCYTLQACEIFSRAAASSNEKRMAASANGAGGRGGALLRGAVAAGSQAETAAILLWHAATCSTFGYSLLFVFISFCIFCYFDVHIHL